MKCKNWGEMIYNQLPCIVPAAHIKLKRYAGIVGAFPLSQSRLTETQGKRIWPMVREEGRTDGKVTVRLTPGGECTPYAWAAWAAQPYKNAPAVSVKKGARAVAWFVV